MDLGAGMGCDGIGPSSDYYVHQPTRPTHRHTIKPHTHTTHPHRCPSWWRTVPPRAGPRPRCTWPTCPAPLLLCLCYCVVFDCVVWVYMKREGAGTTRTSQRVMRVREPDLAAGAGARGGVPAQAGQGVAVVDAGAGGAIFVFDEWLVWVVWVCGLESFKCGAVWCALRCFL